MKTETLKELKKLIKTFENRQLFNNDIILMTGDLKKLITFCNLDWDEKCLHHQRNKMPIKTLSLNQVNKPIYSSSVNSSNNFKEHLKEIFSNFN